MAHAFDNRNFIQGKQQTFYSFDSPRSNHLPPSYEETVGNKTLVNHERQKSGIGQINHLYLH